MFFPLLSQPPRGSVLSFDCLSLPPRGAKRPSARKTPHIFIWMKFHLVQPQISLWDVFYCILGAAAPGPGWRFHLLPVGKWGFSQCGFQLHCAGGGRLKEASFSRLKQKGGRAYFSCVSSWCDLSPDACFPSRRCRALMEEAKVATVTFISADRCKQRLPPFRSAGTNEIH